MDTSNRVIQLCLAGTRAEFEQRPAAARAFYQQAWEAHTDDYEACIAAHYLARFQDSPAETLRWDQAALDHAEAVKDDRARDFYPSLYLSLGNAHEQASHPLEADKYYRLAAELGFVHQSPSAP
jgi:hypothetical protein